MAFHALNGFRAYGSDGNLIKLAAFSPDLSTTNSSAPTATHLRSYTDATAGERRDRLAQVEKPSNSAMQEPNASRTVRCKATAASGESGTANELPLQPWISEEVKACKRSLDLVGETTLFVLPFPCRAILLNLPQRLTRRAG